jgi:hypothetical protein
MAAIILPANEPKRAPFMIFYGNYLFLNALRHAKHPALDK